MKHLILATTIAAVFLLLSAGTSGGEVTCFPVRLKPIRCACGTIINAAGGPVDDAAITLLKDGTALAVVNADQGGKFAFDVSNPGDYEIKAEAPGFQQIRFAVSIVKPQAKCKRALKVKLITAGEECSGVWLVKQ